MVELKCGPDEAGSRIDKYFRKRLPLLGLSEIYGLIRKGGIKVDGKKVKQNYRLKEGDCLQLKIDPSELKPASRVDQSLESLINTRFFKKNFHVLYEDPYILACNKPAGLVVHSGSGHLNHDNLIDMATAYLISKGECSSESQTPVLVHRLDRDTSGVILLAKNKGVTRILHQSMQSDKFGKKYIAVCHHRPPKNHDTVTTTLKRSDRSATGMKMTVDQKGAVSKSSYKLISYQHDLSRVEVTLHTGRTHQIRVQMSYLKAPVVGDVRYGDSTLDKVLFSQKTIPNRLYLHAHKLTFPHPHTKKTLRIEATIPEEFLRILENSI
ncbi:RluA family pseudouridine synthase [Chitinispirillales bacterium ANBcel5]|uniref:RluA family pseudouridine synthase n=1 Tax=Cellulosispirillum alkaliphilum TaxID=3039283 RepID=UPI002A51C94A|nr:RluA family pseudouridine synthase [Chitinispirillales bacterium ANBcel5]